MDASWSRRSRSRPPAGLLMEEIVPPPPDLGQRCLPAPPVRLLLSCRGGQRTDALESWLWRSTNSLSCSRASGSMSWRPPRCCVASFLPWTRRSCFDPEHRLRLSNPAGERIFHLSAAQALGSGADEPNLLDCWINPIRELWFLPARAIPFIGWCGDRVFVSVASLIRSWCCRTSALPCGSRSVMHGSVSSG